MMKLRQLGLLALTVSTQSLWASIPSSGWYAGLMGGVSYAPSITATAPYASTLYSYYFSRLSTAALNVTPNNVITVMPMTTTIQPFAFINGAFPSARVASNIGGNGGGQVGFRLCNFRGEGELLVNYSPVSSVTAGGFKINRNSSSTSLVSVSGQNVLGAGFLNAYYDFYDEESDPTWVPYLGLGVGYGHFRNSLTFTSPFLQTLVNAGVSVKTKFNDSALLGQAILGISYFQADDLSIGLDYRYLSSKNISSIDARYQIHSLNLNFNYYFTD